MSIYRVAFCTLLFCGTVHAAPLYNITSLDVLPGTMESRAFGLNDHGQPVGDSRFDRSGHIGQSRPIVWNAIGEPTELWNDPLIGGSAADINNSGTIVGRYGSGSGTPLPGPGVPFGRGFVWDSINGRRDIGLEPVGNTQAVAINDAGQVVGTSEVLTTVNIEGEQHELFIPRAFIWDETSGIRDLGDLGGFGAFANDVNSQGQVIGYADNPDGFTRAFVWDEFSGIRELPTLGQTSQAVAINDLGQVLGFDFGTGSVIWDLNTGLRQDVAGGIDLNNLGQILGGTVGNPTIFDPIDGTANLLDLIADDSGWMLELVYALSNESEIVGYGRINGELRGFLMTTVPEPSSMAFVLMAFLGAFSSRIYAMRK